MQGIERNRFATCPRFELAAWRRLSNLIGLALNLYLDRIVRSALKGEKAAPTFACTSQCE